MTTDTDRAVATTDSADTDTTVEPDTTATADSASADTVVEPAFRVPMAVPDHVKALAIPMPVVGDMAPLPIADDIDLPNFKLVLQSYRVLNDDERAETRKAVVLADSKTKNFVAGCTETLQTETYVCKPVFKADCAIQQGFRVYETVLATALATPYARVRTWTQTTYERADGTQVREVAASIKTKSLPVTEKLLRDAIATDVDVRFGRKATKDDFSVIERLHRCEKILAGAIGKIGLELVTSERVCEEHEQILRNALEAGQWIFRNLPQLAGMPHGCKFKKRELQQVVILALGEDICRVARERASEAAKMSTEAMKETTIAAQKSGIAAANGEIATSLAEGHAVLATSARRIRRAMQIVLSAILTKRPLNIEMASKAELGEVPADDITALLENANETVMAAKAAKEAEKAEKAAKAKARTARRNSKPVHKTISETTATEAC